MYDQQALLADHRLLERDEIHLTKQGKIGFASMMADCTRSMGNNHDKSVCVQLQESWDHRDVVDGIPDWSVTMKGDQLLRMDRLGKQGAEIALYVKEHLKCIELCLATDEEPNENLWRGTERGQVKVI